MNINEVRIGGRIGSLEMAYSKSGSAILTINLATNESFKEGNDWKEKTLWHRLKAFGKTAETINKYCSKGSQIYLEAKLAYSDYEKDGRKIYSTDLIVRKAHLIFNQNKGEQKQMVLDKDKKELEPAFAAQINQLKEQGMVDNNFKAEDIPF